MNRTPELHKSGVGIEVVEQYHRVDESYPPVDGVDDKHKDEWVNIGGRGAAIFYNPWYDYGIIGAGGETLIVPVSVFFHFDEAQECAENKLLDARGPELI